MKYENVNCKDSQDSYKIQGMKIEIKALFYDSPDQRSQYIPWEQEESFTFGHRRAWKAGSVSRRCEASGSSQSFKKVNENAIEFVFRVSEIFHSYYLLKKVVLLAAIISSIKGDIDSNDHHLKVQWDIINRV